jgi:hypothetical protein
MTIEPGSPRKKWPRVQKFAEIVTKTAATTSNFARDSFIWALVYCPDYIAVVILSMKSHHEASTV